jgi:hypothetical protein
MRPVNRFFSATFTGALPVVRPRRRGSLYRLAPDA